MLDFWMLHEVNAVPVLWREVVYSESRTVVLRYIYERTVSTERRNKKSIGR